MPQALQQQLTQNPSATLEVLITAPQAEVDRVASTYGVRVVTRLSTGAVLSGTGAQLDAVAGDPNVSALSMNDVVFSTMAVTTESTGASQLWKARGSSSSFSGLTGLGIGVAVIDSGIAAHPDIAQRIKYSLDLTDEEGVADGYGHGTHVGAIIAGNGSGSRSSDGLGYIGMAPGAELISLKVLGSDGTGYVADVIAAIDWCVRNRERFRIRIINLSLGHEPTSAYQDDPLVQAVNRAVDAGILVVASAGNHGKTEDGTEVVAAIVSPGDAPAALTVGALNTRGTVSRSDDAVASYSSRGPVGEEDDPSNWIIKPDVVAPGNAIVSAGAVGSYLWENFPSRQVIGARGGTYLTLSGASMATAVVSGAAAQLLQLNPKLTPAEVKFALQFTATPLENFGLMEQGAGSINVPLAAALVRAGEVEAAPVSNVIGGETVESGQLAFGNTIVWGARGGNVGGNTIVWGARGGNVGGNTIVWGARGGSVGGDTIVWGARGGNVGGDTIVWGARGGNVGGDTIVWGARGGKVGGDTIVWGARGGNVGGDTIVWGARDGD